MTYSILCLLNVFVSCVLWPDTAYTMEDAIGPDQTPDEVLEVRLNKSHVFVSQSFLS